MFARDDRCVSGKSKMWEIRRGRKSCEAGEEGSWFWFGAGVLSLCIVFNPRRLQPVVNLLAVFGINHHAWSMMTSCIPLLPKHTCSYKPPSRTALAWPPFFLHNSQCTYWSEVPIRAEAGGCSLQSLQLHLLKPLPLPCGCSDLEGRGINHRHWHVL